MSAPLAAVLLGLCAGVASAQAADAPIWTHASDGSWIGSNVALGARGSQACGALGTLPVETTLLSGFDAAAPTPVWTDTTPGAGLHARVASADATDVHVVLHQETVGGGPWRQAVVRRYASDSWDPVWSFAHPALIADHPYADVRLSEDGAVTAVAVYDFAIGGTVLAVLGPDSATPLAVHEVSTFGPFTDYALAADGSVALFASTAKLTAVDVASGATLLSKYLIGQPNYGALGLSGDGGRLAFGTTAKVDVYQLAGGAYQLEQTHALDPSQYCRRLALSGDGSTLALAFHDSGDALTLRVRAVDLASGAATMEYAVTGGGGLQNLASEVAIAHDGSRFVVGSWGDADGLAPELLGFRRALDQPVLSANLDGSVLDLDLSGDGRTVAVASKGTHANQWGGGGALSLWRVGASDLVVSGVPRPGATLEVRHAARAGESSTVYAAGELASTPQSLPGMGPGLCWLGGAPADWTAHPTTTAGGDNQATTWITLPDDPATIGTTLYLQALAAGGDAGWSGAFAQITVLP